MTDVLMPRLSDSMQEGTILTWLVPDGGPVRSGEELAEIETDKATMTYEAETDGTLSVVVPAGSSAAVGEVIARVGDASASTAGAGRETQPTVAQVAQRGDDAGAPEPAGRETQPTVARAAPLGGNGHVAATPMARRIATAHGIALDRLSGSGPRGRIVRADVERAAGLTPTPVPPTPTAPTAEGDRRVEPTRLQSTIARRMAEATATVPHFQVQTEVEMTAALAFREGLRDAARASDVPAPSINDLVVRACALCLRRFPRANGSWVDGGFDLHGRVNVGIAVAADGALVVPVLHDADRLSLGEIARRTRELAAAVRDGSVTAPQLSSGTFTVSNLGMYGMTAITPVVNPPQAAILGVGAVRETLGRGEDGAVVDRRPLTLTLSCDHRILYGADAAQFLAAVRGLLESPHGLAL